MSVDEWIRNATDEQLLEKRSDYAAKRFSFRSPRDSDLLNQIITDLDVELRKRGLTITH